MKPNRLVAALLGLAAVTAPAGWTGCAKSDARRASTRPGRTDGCSYCAVPGPVAVASTTSTAFAPPGPQTGSAAAARRVHVFVTGRVQGVGFRAFTQDKAVSLGLTGWVRNLPDGRVEAVIEGPPTKVAALLEHVRTGPPTGKVDGVQVADEAPSGEFRTFDVRR